MIVIIDYNVGNLKSVLGAFKRIGLDAVVSRDEKIIKEAKGIVLPGVGTFPTAMKNLEKYHLVELLKERKEAGIPILGICLGMQLLFEESEEYGPKPGLGLIPGKVKEIPRDLGLSVPHMGWNKNVVHQSHSAFSNVDDQYTYFVHSYYVDTDPEFITSTANYGIDVPGVVERGRVYGMQFHPEKSGVVGLNLLRTFGNITEAYAAVK